ncbi:MAG: cysteine desulfurase [Rhodospirillaceae bacterium]|nr:MAG: cysteine desulfurase [Rhodospirillaceae bacterium]
MTAAARRLSSVPAFDVDAIRADFPILARQVHGKPLVYLDSAASAQKPRAVIEAITRAYTDDYANVHRGAYYLSETSTVAYEAAREKVRAFINASSTAEIVFTKGATEAINLIAASYGRAFIKAGDEIVLTALEHHSNIVPWDLLRTATGCVIRVVPVAADGTVALSDFAASIGPRTKLVAVAHVSNVLGTILPIRAIADLAHAAGAKILIDGCQGIVHAPVDVRALDCDFYAFSGHKLYGPTGIGVLWAREALLDAMPPYQGGGDMIETVAFSGCTWAPLPAKFEAGTPPIVQAIGLGAAIDYVTAQDRDAVRAHEERLLAYATAQLGQIPGLRLIGTAPGKAAVQSFVMDGAHPHDIATVLDRSGVCVRAGHHCAQPLMEVMGVPATARASFAMYNTITEVDALVTALIKARELLT